MRDTLNELKLKVLCHISQIVGQALDLDQTLEVILGILSEHLAMQRATITLMDGERNRLGIRASHGLTPDEKSRGVYRLDEGVTGHIFRTRRPFVVPDIRKEPLFLDKTGSRKIEKGRIAFIGVPILLHGHPIGVLSVDRLFGEDVSFDEDIEFLTILAALVAQFVSLNDRVRAREDRLIRANRSLKSELSEKCTNFFASATSPAMVQVQEHIRRVAPTKASVLLLGESGTGKTLVAQIIHELSDRVGFPFVKVNCAALPESLLESELFGYEKGAFTGASEARAGRVEQANGGTIFLDEIGELPMPLQAKLLRFLQEREFERLGSNRTRSVDVRIIAATNKELDAEVKKGDFREDLYYRLNVFPVRVPPLRDREEDIPSLVGFFADKLCREYNCSLRFTATAMRSLVDHSWPGNVRELENLIERLAIMADGGDLDAADVAPYVSWDRRFVDATRYVTGTSLKDIERSNVLAALERNHWKLSRAAGDLGITLRQMGYRVKKFGLQDVVKDRKHALR